MSLLRAAALEGQSVRLFLEMLARYQVTAIDYPAEDWGKEQRALELAKEAPELG